MIDLTENEVQRLMQQFRDIGCKVTFLEDTSFEIVPDTIAVQTHVFATTYFLQFTTFLGLHPKGIFGRLKMKRDAFLNEANQFTNIMKLSCEEVDFDAAWKISCSTRLATGENSRTYNNEAIRHYLTLWLMDLSAVMRIEQNFKVVAMIKNEK